MSPKHSSPLATFLGKVETNVPLDAADREAFLGLPQVVKPLRRHEFIARDNEMPRHCCVLASGYAMRHKSTGNGARQIFSIHMRGDAVDLHNSMLGKADHNVQMLSSGEGVFVRIEALRELAKARPAISQAILYDALVDAAIFREWTLNVGRRDARSRMAHMLCEFALRLEVAGLGEAKDYQLPMTQEELADALALTPIHVGRTFKSLAEEGLVERDARGIRIPDWHALVKVGDFDSGYLHLTPPGRAVA